MATLAALQSFAREFTSLAHGASLVLLSLVWFRLDRRVAALEQKASRELE